MTLPLATILAALFIACSLGGWPGPGIAQEASADLAGDADTDDAGSSTADASSDSVDDPQREIRIGYVIDVPDPISADAATRIIGQMKRLAESSGGTRRHTVVLRYRAEDKMGLDTEFEDALKLARAITSSDLRALRIVSLVEADVEGHSVLPILASELLLVSPSAVIGNASAGESIPDQTIVLTYRSIAESRGLFDPAIAEALVDPEIELARVDLVNGRQVFASGEGLKEIRQSGQVLQEETWSNAGAPLRLSAKQLRTARIAAGIVDSLDAAAELLDLGKLNPVSEALVQGDAKGVLLEITGAIVPRRARRWQSNLSSTLDSDEINTWLITIDSTGGSLDKSAELAGWFADPQPPLRIVAGMVRGEARGDAALVALACKPLWMHPESRIGGPGADAIDRSELQRYDEVIQHIATSTNRPAALIRGLLDPTLVVYRYTHRKTGRIRYATEDDLVRGAENPDAERERWDRGARIELSDGLSSAEAISLGLADGEAQTLQDVARRIGLSEVPPELQDRKLIHFIERIGRSNTLAFLLLFIGFAALSAEANAPGLSLPGFVALLCFALYFWMKFLAGTAEWLELIAFSLGIICIAIEIFVVPGFGVFGIGGLILTVLSIVLMSQTFDVPRNVYQLQVLTRSLWVALGGAAGMVGGFIVMRMMLPHVPLFRGLVMEVPDAVEMDQAEKLGDYSMLLGQTGISTTPLRPAGKARFGDQIVPVVSDGTAIAAGEPVHVCQVQGTKVVVEPVENA